MPVDGYHHKRVWQYQFRPQPFQVLDRSWVNHDRQWEHDVVERIRHGGGAPQSVATAEAVSGGYTYYRIMPEGWEAAEHHAANAVRTGSAYFTDTEIAKRAKVRAQLKEALKEAQARDKIRLEESRKRQHAEFVKTEERRAAAKAALDEEIRIWNERHAERERRRIEQDQAWAKSEEDLRKLRSFATTPPPPRDRQAIERDIILAAKWECAACKHPAEIMVTGPTKYLLTCASCCKFAEGEHQRLLVVARSK